MDGGDVPGVDGATIIAHGSREGNPRPVGPAREAVALGPTGGKPATRGLRGGA
jgi:hypothetical protein